MSVVRKNLWIGALLFSLLMIGLGGFFVAKGVSTKSYITDQLSQEKVTTSADAVKFGVPAGLPVTNATTAQAQSAVIRYHSIEAANGKTYSELARTDPARTTYLQGLELRNALNMAVMGFGVAQFAMGVGAVLIVIGVAGVGLLTPAMFWIREHEREMAKGYIGQPAGASAGK